MHHRSWRLSPALAACALALLVSNGIARAQTAGAPPPDFGSAPSGEIPILFSPLDKHVYAKPDRLRHGRVLAALVRGGTILVPLRSLFEQLGATVAYDASARSVEVSKAGSDLKLTVGEPSVTINGETRPLDVAPEEVRGVVFVPLRVIAEAMGAYVVWVPDKQVVVVRYVPPPSPPPAPAYTPPPAQATPEPTRVPKPVRTPYYERFAAADYLIGPATYNELDPGNPTYGNTFDARAVAELPLGTGRIMIEGDYQGLEFRHNSTLGPSGCSAKSAGCGTVIGSDPNYQTGYCPSSDPGCVTVIGYQNLQSSIGLGQAYATSFTAYETDFQGHLAYQVAAPRIYVGIGGYVKQFSYLGYPTLGGIGAGIEKLPDLDRPYSVYGSLWYYPTIGGNYHYPTSVYLGALSGQQIQLQYSALLYDIGATYGLGKTPAFLQGGFRGQQLNAKENAPGNRTQSSGYAGIGLHF